MFFIGETGLKWKQLAAHWQAEGNLRLGFWGHNGTFLSGWTEAKRKARMDFMASR